MKRLKTSLFALACLAMLSGCGKKDDVTDDFKDVQGTVSDAGDIDDTATNDMGPKKTEQVTIKGQTYDVYFDEQDVEGRTNKVFTAKEVTMDEGRLQKLANDFFDNGEFYEVTIDDYETLNVPDGDLFELITHDVDGVTYSYYQSLLRGNVNGEPWILFAYFYHNDDDALTGYFSFDFQSLESWQDEKYYAEYDVDGFECSLDLDQTILDGENILRQLGYEGYECVATKGLAEQMYGAQGDSRGYSVTYARSIDGSACGAYMNRCLMSDDAQEHKTTIESVTMDFNENGLFWLTKDEYYDVDVNSGKEVNLFGLDEAKRVALKEIENNLQDEDVLGFGVDFFNSNSQKNDEEEATPITVSLKYVPVFCDEEILFVPAYLFTMTEYEEDWGTNAYIVAAISALDGTVIKPDFF